MMRQRPEVRRLLAAEYVLGTLRGPARRRFERLREEDAAYCDEADAWEMRLSSLVELLPGVEPPAQVWKQVKQQIGNQTHPTTVPPRLRDRIGFWQVLGLASSALAACLAVFILLTRAAPPTFAPTHLAVIEDFRETPVWLLHFDREEASYRAQALVDQVAPDGKSFELWLIPDDGQPPVSLGLLPTSGTRRFALSDDLAALLDPAHSLGVTLEPFGGSPTGQASGPLQAKGRLIVTPR